MKKYSLFLLLTIVLNTLNAQYLLLIDKDKLDIDHHAYFASFGNSSSHLIYTDENKNGLIIYDLETKTETKVLDGQGLIQKAYFDHAGNLNFTQVEYKNKRRVNRNKSYDLNAKLVTDATTDDLPEFEAKVSGKSIEIVSKGISKNTLQPMGEVYYLWTSFSPDRSKIVFTVPGKGSYVCDRNGNNIHELGYLNAPQWINNNWIVGMNDRDDGDRIVASDIMAIHVKSGKKYNLTNQDKNIALYPHASADGNQIVYHTLDGQVFLLTISTME